MKPVENSNLKDWNKRISEQIRLKEKRLIYARYWKWDIDSSKKVAQEIVKKLRNYEESVAKKHIESAATMSQLLTQILDLQNKVNSFVWCKRIFTILRQRAALSVPRSQSTLDYSESQRSAKPRFWIAAWYRYTMVTSGNVFESLAAGEGSSSALFENSPNLTSSSCGLGQVITGNIMKHERGERRESQSSTIVTPRFNQDVATLSPISHTRGTYSHNGMMDYPKFPILEMHLGKFPNSLEFPSWKVNFETDVCSKSAVPHITMHWIKEVEIVKSIDDLMTSRSITGRTDFPDYDTLEMMMTSALKKLLTHVHFRKRVRVEKQPTCSEIRSILTRKANYKHDPWAFSSPRTLWSCTRSIRRMMMFRISTHDASKLH